MVKSLTNFTQLLHIYAVRSDGADLFTFVYGYPTWLDYLTSMEKDGTRGNNLILQTAANYYKTRIRIVSSLDHENMIEPYGG